VICITITISKSAWRGPLAIKPPLAAPPVPCTHNRFDRKPLAMFRDPTLSRLKPDIALRPINLRTGRLMHCSKQRLYFINVVPTRFIAH
jgi:hypothetical protein